MATEIILPKLGQTMEEGVIVEWLKAEGDSVGRGDVLFTVESDKAVLEVEATARGYLRKIFVPEGQTVPVLSVVGLISRSADEDVSGHVVSTTEALGEPVKAAESSVPEIPQDEPATILPARPGRVFASPRARKAAREKGVELALVAGTGPNSRISERDVLKYMAARPKVTPVAARTAQTRGVDLTAVTGSGIRGRIVKADVDAAAADSALEATASSLERVPLSGLRRIVSERMAASDASTARVTLVTEVDASEFVEARTRLKEAVEEEWGFAPGYNDLLGLIVARVLQESPHINARLSEDGASIERMAFINLGMAVDTDRGLLVPVIRNADQKGLHALSAEFRTLVDRARSGKSLPDDLSGGTFTITNLGMYEIDAFTPIINLPEAAILGVGRIHSKPVVREDQVVVRKMWTLSLVIDHRLVDGAPAARFLQRIKELVENPLLLLS
ncbi:dihydrolipoamide acetyltransferase family protein [Chloroflexota bacterium]